MTAYASFHAIETDRLRAHFEWVLAVLRAQDTSALSAEARARREATLAELEAYAERGAFPHNVVSEEMMPAFIDDRGVTCAVAELMIRSGAGELAGCVRDRMNFASIGQMLAVMPGELEAWAARAGLTPVEMAMVQPSYCGQLPPCQRWTANSPGNIPGCPQPEPCCETRALEDGVQCRDEYGSFEGTCEAGECVEPEPPPDLPGVFVEDDGCTVAMVDLGAGSIAPLLAAVFLLTLRRRAGRRTEVRASRSAPGDRRKPREGQGAGPKRAGGEPPNEITTAG